MIASPDRKLPLELADRLRGHEWERATSGQSGNVVFRLALRGFDDLYLKHADAQAASALADEKVRLEWLGGRMGAPSVVDFVQTSEEAWLLTTAVRGESVFDALRSGEAGQEGIVDAAADFLRKLHSIPVESCPFIGDHMHRLASARRNIDAGLVDEEDFDDERSGWTAERVWDALQELLPIESDLVVTHGDFSLDNLLIRGSEITGCIDVGRLGLADRYQDLAIFWNALGEFDPIHRTRFLDRYGVSEVDEKKLLFFTMLDELF